MNFYISDELKEKIKVYFKDYDDLKNKLLSGDENTIKKIGIISQERIAPEDVIKAYESNNMDHLYNKAKKMVELEKIYRELCIAHSLNVPSKKKGGLEEK